MQPGFPILSAIVVRHKTQSMNGTLNPDDLNGLTRSVFVLASHTRWLVSDGERNKKMIAAVCLLQFCQDHKHFRTILYTGTSQESPRNILETHFNH